MTDKLTKEQTQLFAEGLCELVTQSCNEVLEVIKGSEKKLKDFGITGQFTTIFSSIVAQEVLHVITAYHTQEIQQNFMNEKMEQLTSILEKESLTNDEIH